MTPWHHHKRRQRLESFLLVLSALSAHDSVRKARIALGLPDSSMRALSKDMGLPPIGKHNRHKHEDVLRVMAEINAEIVKLRDAEVSA